VHAVGGCHAIENRGVFGGRKARGNRNQPYGDRLGELGIDAEFLEIGSDLLDMQISRFACLRFKFRFFSHHLRSSLWGLFEQERCHAP